MVQEAFEIFSCRDKTDQIDSCQGPEVKICIRSARELTGSEEGQELQRKIGIFQLLIILLHLAHII